MKLQYLGFGIGLRTKHYQELLATQPKIDWLEIISENFMLAGGPALTYLDKFKQKYPIVMHGVSMSLGSADPLNLTYLQELKQLAKHVKPKWISDHLCWTGINNINTHDLLPLPFTEETIKHMVAKIRQAQDFLETQLVLENISSYLRFTQSTMPEWEFITEIITRANCYLLLDVNNVYVNSRNFGFNPEDFINNIPKNKVVQIHLAGHDDMQDYVIDTHGTAISNPVWQLYAKAIQRFGLTSTLIERDSNIPPLIELLKELDHAKKIAKNYTTMKNKVTT